MLTGVGSNPFPDATAAFPPPTAWTTREITSYNYIEHREHLYLHFVIGLLTHVQNRIVSGRRDMN